MIKKLLAIIVLVIVASLSMAGCTSSTSSNQAASSASQVASATATPAPVVVTKTKVIVVPEPAAVATPPPTPNIQMWINGPTLVDGGGKSWSVSVEVNGVMLSGAQLNNKINWFIDGKSAGGIWNSGYLIFDSNGGQNAFSQGTHVLNAEYTGDPSLPNTSIVVTVTA
ncbi:MAG: hypothetical protein WAL97_07470 [Halobacteriota archaeon]